MIEPEHTDWIDNHNISKNPYNNILIAYQIAQGLGHPIEFRDDAIAENGALQPDLWHVMVDTRETQVKLGVIYEELLKTQMFWLVFDMEYPRPNQFYSLAQGDPNALGYYLDHYKPANLDQPDIDAMFMRSFEKSETLSRQNPQVRSTRPPTEAYNAQQAYFDRLASAGVRPIEPERITGLIRPIIGEILVVRPELTPQGKLDGRKYRRYFR